MKSILITGGTGLIGKKLINELKKKQYNIYVLTRRGSYVDDNVNYLEWKPDESKLDITGISNLFSIIHLAGESINGSRWTKAYKKKILESRVLTTRLLFQNIKNQDDAQAAFEKGDFKRAPSGWTKDPEDETGKTVIKPEDIKKKHHK